MNRTDSPAKQPKPFGINGPREPLLNTTPAGDNTASYDSGFPPITMTLKSAGGIPPKGQDMNQILYELSSLCRWSSAGALYSFDQNFCTAVSGYPKGAILLGDDGITIYKSTTDGNTNNPNVTTTGWFNLTTGYLLRANPFADIKADGTISTALTNINLDRIEQRSGETVIFSDNNKDKYLTSRSDNSWGYYNSTLNRFIPLSLSAGGTGVSSIAELKTALGLKSGAYGEVRTGSVTGTGNKTFSTPFPQGIVSGIAFCAVTSTGYMYSASVGSVSGSGFSFKPVYSSGGGNPILAADGELFYYIAWGA